MEYYDYVIIGAGISGMYTGYKLLKNNITNFVIIEKNPYVGGRLRTYNFEKTTLPLGAGIGRFGKDLLLQKLMEEIGLPVEKFPMVFEYSENIKRRQMDDIVEILSKPLSAIELLGPCLTLIQQLIQLETIDKSVIVEKLKSVNINNKQWNSIIKCKLEMMLNYLRAVYKATPKEDRTVSFREFSIMQFGRKRYELLRDTLGYTDYESADCGDVLFFYELEDNYQDVNSIGFSLKWNLIINNLHQILFHHIYIETDLKSFKRLNNQLFEITCDQVIMTDNESHDNVKYCAKNIVFANNMDVIQKYDCIYNQILPQNFTRVYAKINKSQSSAFYEKIDKNATTIVSNQLQKIIPIRYDEGIFMIGYSDNQNAEVLSHYRNDTEENHRFFEKYIENALSLQPNSVKIEKVRIFFWNTGTHYYTPMDYTKYNSRKEFIMQAQLPKIPNCYVVGECVSINQGWVNSALESVEIIFDKILTKTTAQ